MPLSYARAGHKEVTVPSRLLIVAVLAALPLTAGVKTFTNPVINADFPDPFIIQSGKDYYAFATNAGTANVQAATSTDLVHWVSLPDALPVIGSWASPGDTWAPEVLKTATRFVMYYVARDTASGRQCIGAAISSRAQGPYADAEAKPLICQTDMGGSIDPSPFTDTGGQNYLYWKNDGNCCGMNTNIFVSRLTPDGLNLKGRPVELIHNTELWEGPLIEAPSVYKRAGKYYLFYSASSFESSLYGVGFALGFSPLGPFSKLGSRQPILETNAAVAGPGGQGVIADRSGKPWMYYHAWDPEYVGYAGGGRRALYISPLVFKDGLPHVSPTVKTQPAPGVK